MIASERIPHLLLLVGPKKSGKSEAAHTFSSHLLLGERASEREAHLLKQGNHPDLHIYHPEGRTGMHSLDKMRHLCSDVFLSAHEKGGYKCFIVYDAERMLPSSANQLLKTFEEPPEKTVILLLSSEPHHILPTICSRAQTVRFQGGEKEELNDWQERLLEIMCGKRLLPQILALATEIEKERATHEAQLMRTMPKESGAQQKKSLQKEFEGVAMLQFSKNVDGLFQTIYQFYRDRDLLEQKGSDLKRFLIYGDRAKEIAKVAHQPLAEVEKLLQKAHLSQQRSVKLTTCLEALFIAL